jgi:hypothetical protein
MGAPCSPGEGMRVRALHLEASWMPILSGPTSSLLELLFNIRALG